MENIYIVTDGSCLAADNKTGFDAAAAYLILDSKFRVIHKESILLKDHTNNYAEMYAIYKGTKYIIEKLSDKLEIWNRIIVITDSQLCEKTLNEWMMNWLKNTDNEVLMNTTGKVKNQELVKSTYINILTLKLNFTVFICHMNSHKTEKDIPNMYVKFMDKYDYDKLQIEIDDFKQIFKANQIVDKMAYNQLNSIKQVTNFYE